MIKIMIAFQIFGFSIYWYGIFYAISFLLGYFALGWIGKQKRFSNYPKIQSSLTERLEDILFVIALGVLIGGRLGHVLIYGNGYYFHHFIEIFKVWEGGMSFIGGILGVVLSVSIYSIIKKLTKKDLLTLFDLILIVVPLGIFFGRFGNYLNQELYGIPLSALPNWFAQILSTLGLAHHYTKIDDILRVNTNFLSMIFEGLMIFCIQIGTFWKMIKNKQFQIGILSTNFLFFYSLIRFGLEYLRADSQGEFIGLFTKSQRFFIPFMITALIIRWKIKKNQTLNLS